MRRPPYSPIISFTIRSHPFTAPTSTSKLNASEPTYDHTAVMALALADKNIRVNALSPGAMRTLSLAGISGGKGMLSKGRDLSAMKQDTSMEGVAGAALWLLSDLGRSTTGELIHVDAGFHMMGFSDDEEA